MADDQEDGRAVAEVCQFNPHIFDESESRQDSDLKVQDDDDDILGFEP